MLLAVTCHCVTVGLALSCATTASRLLQFFWGPLDSLGGNGKQSPPRHTMHYGPGVSTDVAHLPTLSTGQTLLRGGGAQDRSDCYMKIKVYKPSQALTDGTQALINT
jgi:hypothetical protein